MPYKIIQRKKPTVKLDLSNDPKIDITLHLKFSNQLESLPNDKREKVKREIKYDVESFLFKTTLYDTDIYGYENMAKLFFLSEDGFNNYNFIKNA